MSKKIVVSLAALFVAATTLVGCTTATTKPAADPVVPVVTSPPAAVVPQAADDYTQFLADANSSGTAYDNQMPDKALVQFGTTVCSELDSGMSITDVLQQLVTAFASTGADGLQYVGFLFGVSVADLCPTHATAVKDFLSANGISS